MILKLPKQEDCPEILNVRREFQGRKKDNNSNINLSSKTKHAPPVKKDNAVRNPVTRVNFLTLEYNACAVKVPWCPPTQLTCYFLKTIL